MSLLRLDRAVHFGGPGDQRVEEPVGEVITFAALQCGTMIPLPVSRLSTTSNTVTAILGLP